MKRISPLTKDQAVSSLCKHLDRWFEYGAERYNGFHIGRLFYLNYRDGKDGSQWIYNSAVLYLSGKEKTTVHFWPFYGLTNPVDIFIFYCLFLSLLYIRDQNAGIASYLLGALIGPVGAAALTWLPSYLSSRGQKGSNKLYDYVEEHLKIGKPGKTEK